MIRTTRCQRGGVAQYAAKPIPIRLGSACRARSERLRRANHAPTALRATLAWGSKARKLANRRPMNMTMMARSVRRVKELARLLGQERERSGRSFEEILAPYLATPPVKPGPAQGVRDQEGWRVPRDGTSSRVIYDLAKSGRSAAEIRQKLPSLSRASINVMLCHMKNPGAPNNRAKLLRQKRRVQSVS